jgi:hypothetical protein
VELSRKCLGFCCHCPPWTGFVGGAAARLGRARPDLQPSLPFSSKLSAPALPHQCWPSTASSSTYVVVSVAPTVSIGKSSHHLSPPLHHDDHITITSESKTVKSKNFQAQQADCLYTLCIVYSLEILHADMSSSRLPCTRPMRSRSIKRAVQIVYIANRILPMSFTYPSE